MTAMISTCEQVSRLSDEEFAELILGEVTAATRALIDALVLLHARVEGVGGFPWESGLGDCNRELPGLRDKLGELRVTLNQYLYDGPATR
jgi:hypothetical protein